MVLTFTNSLSKGLQAHLPVFPCWLLIAEASDFQSNSKRT
uniref:Uncharacterized protein n=1 Tax=Arundo donax TaxID=35708 RepID=A0A0A9HEE0_ARUDO